MEDKNPPKYVTLSQFHTVIGFILIGIAYGFYSLLKSDNSLTKWYTFVFFIYGVVSMYYGIHLKNK